ncbi:5-(carboxyamino)imidazole ribonucleotide synthase [Geminicoccus flavidas]|uniref:5-(carboxyamino)imidazole ribonucleotide synthase n=1 Tax=Geminicoccus flavidas TaxID=2506407 RepID=UPI001359D6B5|nr:5-(carboxyamino)imidazole ribonucleotide synthase [Geminicoccus flavidas]
MPTIPPGSTIGILGGGQLGRMTALAAARLGYRCHIFAPDAEAPAALVSAAYTRAAFDDRAALDRFADAVDVVTLEWENVPTVAVERLAERVPVRPGAAALAICQERVAEKRFVQGLGIEVTPFAAVGNAAELDRAAADIGLPAVLKTTRLGYDGKGQTTLRDQADLEGALERIGGGPAILEAFVAFDFELSVVTARGTDGSQASFDPVENRHAKHVLALTLAPARLSAAQRDQAIMIAERIAQALDLVGVLGVEMFCTTDGRLLVNELAPRPHNSGHWTMDACRTDQFEQLVRAVCGLPLGDPARHHDAIMRNLLGAEADAWAGILAKPGDRLHLYGKAQAKPGRKMGHVNRLYPLGGRPERLEDGEDS